MKTTIGNGTTREKVLAWAQAAVDGESDLEKRIAVSLLRGVALEQLNRNEVLWEQIHLLQEEYGEGHPAEPLFELIQGGAEK